MPGEAVRVEGLRSLNKALRDAGPEVKTELKDAGKEAAGEVLTLAERLAPRRSGTLAKTLRVGATLRSSTVKAGTRRAPYAGPIHFGWPKRHIAPNPFLWDALDRRRDEIVRLYSERLTAVVDHAFGDGT